jgi:phage baseplate assembly protein W
MYVDYPYHIDGRGRTAQAGDFDHHIRDLIEEVLFTSPGERVNRPTFGSGLMGLVFAPNSSELASAVEFMAHGALEQWLGDLIMVEAITVEHEDATLSVSVQFVTRRSRERRVEQFARGAA